MNEIIEAVGRAIYARRPLVIVPRNKILAWGALSTDTRQPYLDDARAAIEAMLRAIREPSDEMIDAGTRVTSPEIADAAEGKGRLAGMLGVFAIDNANRQETAETWIAMIDALLASAAGARSAETEGLGPEDARAARSEAKGDAQPTELSRQQP